MSGSGIFSKDLAVNPSLVTPGKGGIAGEVGDLRVDVAKAFAPLAAICVEEFTNALATAANNVMAASATPATTVSSFTLLPVAGGGTNKLTKASTDNLLGIPRQLTFTSAGTEAQVPTTATVYGSDARGRKISEVVTLQTVAGLVSTSYFYSEIDKIVYSVGKGASATIAIGLGAAIGLSRTIVKRAGAYAAIKEIAGGSVVTNGVYKLASEATSATVTGTVDLVTAVPVMPTTQVLVVEIDGIDKTITFANPADLAAIVAAVNVVCGASFASAGGVGSKFLTFTDNTTKKGTASTIKVVSGTASILTVLGFTAGQVYQGVSCGQYGTYTPSAALDGSTDFAVYYEFNGAIA